MPSSKRGNKKPRIIESPTQADLQTLVNFVKSNRQYHYNELQHTFTYEMWHELGKTTMVSILLANCAYPADVETLTINDYKQIQSNANLFNDKMLQSLNPEFQEIVKSYYVLANNKVNKMFIINEQQKMALDCIIRNRVKMRLDKQNPYIFGLPSEGSLKVIQSYRALQNYAKACGASNPKLLRSTNLQNIKLSARILDTTTNEALSDLLSESDMAYKLMNIVKISLILLDSIKFFGDNGFQVMKQYEEKVIHDYGEPLPKKIKNSEDDDVAKDV